jgi:hypothetical protein
MRCLKLSNKNRLEELFKSIKGVISVKIVEKEDVIEEIHVLADLSRNPKQVTRDLQSAALSQYDIDLDYRKISVAQLNFMSEEFVKNRIKIDKIGYELYDSSFEAKVFLSIEDKLVSGSVITSPLKDKKYIAFASATIEAIAEVTGLTSKIFLSELRIVEFGSETIVLVLIDIDFNGRHERVSGSSVVKDDIYLSCVKAVLDSINRKIKIA